jgi:hypothetical protein
MRKHKREIKSRDEIEEILGLARVMRLALCVDDQPYVVPLNFGYRDGVLYFHCAQKGRKLDMIRRNPNVSFEVESDVEIITGELPCDWTTHFRSVIGFGKAAVVEDEAEKRLGMDVLMAHHKAKPGEYEPHNFKLATIVRVDIDEMTGKKYLGSQPA